MNRLKKILIVDDEQNIRNALMRVFGDTDYLVESADGGETALKKLGESEFDMVVSDIKMPGMNGYELLTIVKERYPETTRIILSGDIDQKMVFKAIQSNVAKIYLHKPWNNDGFLKIIDQIFETESILKGFNIFEQINNADEIPTIKSSYQKILQMIEADEDFHRITKEIEKDQAITTKILHVVNSSFYGLKTGSIKNAIVYIGMKNVRSLIISTALIESFNVSARLSKLVNEQWEFSFITNKLVYFIYENLLNKKIPEEAASAGLLHNIGIIFMIYHNKEAYLNLKEGTNFSSEEFLAREQDVYGVTHQEIGGYLMKWWELPYSIVEAALYHHNPLNPNIINQELVAAVHIASMYAHEIMGDNKHVLVKSEVFALLKVSKNDFEKKLKLLYEN